MLTMKLSAAVEVARLQKQTTAQLRAVYTQVFGKTPATNNRSFLFKRLALKAQEPGYAAALKARGKNTVVSLAAEQPQPIRDPRLPGVGAVLTKTYKGRDLKVLVGEKDFTFQGVSFRSLSAIARTITGTPWNGFLFFDLIPTEKAS